MNAPPEIVLGLQKLFVVVFAPMLAMVCVIFGYRFWAASRKRGR